MTTELTKAIGTDVGLVLEYWIRKNPCDLSFHSFQHIWKGDNDNNGQHLPSLCNLIHCFPGTKNDYIDQKNEKMIQFSQIIFLSLFLMLFQPNDNTKRYINQKIDIIDISNDVTLEEKQMISQCIWNVGVIYTIVSLYYTQPASVKNTHPSNQEKLPIRVNIETFAQLLLAVERISLLSRSISAPDAELLIDKMEKDNAFCIGAFTGFRILGRDNDSIDANANKIDLSGIASANQSCKSDKIVNVAKYFLDSINNMSVKILTSSDAELTEQQQHQHRPHHLDALNDVQQRRKAYKDSRKPKQSCETKRNSDSTGRRNAKSKKGPEAAAAKITLTIDENQGNNAFTPLTSNRHNETNSPSLSLLSKKRKVAVTHTDVEDLPPSWTDSQATFETSDFDDFFGETSQQHPTQSLSTQTATVTTTSNGNEDDGRSNNKKQEKPKKKIKKDIELLTMMINSQT